MNINIWQFILEQLEANNSVVMLIVIESLGSSPGRKGFKMVLSKTGEMRGSIGGGIMEHKLIDLSRELIEREETSISIKRQIHSESAPRNKSGMICSGEQTVAIVPLNRSNISVVKDIIKYENSKDESYLILRDSGFSVEEDPEKNQIQDSEYMYHSERLGFKDVVHIFGAGHVALELSFILHWLGFYIKIYDDRAKLNTLQDNRFVHDKVVLEYEDMSSVVSDKHDYFVIVSFGFRTDKLILQNLLSRNFKYLGMMGSKAKTARIMSELREEGLDEALLKKVHAPIGVPISSKTPKEIAISIAAEITQVKRGDTTKKN